MVGVALGTRDVAVDAAGEALRGGGEGAGVRGGRCGREGGAVWVWAWTRVWV